MGYSPREPIPAGDWLPTMSGVPPLDLAAQRRYYQRNTDLHAAIRRRAVMAFVAPERPMAPRPPRREACIWQHCVSEAKREIDCLTIGRLYRWQPYEE